MYALRQFSILYFSSIWIGTCGDSSSSSISSKIPWKRVIATKVEWELSRYFIQTSVFKDSSIRYKKRCTPKPIKEFKRWWKLSHSFCQKWPQFWCLYRHIWSVSPLFSLQIWVQMLLSYHFQSGKHMPLYLNSWMKHYNLYFNTRFPFNVKAPIGYTIAVGMEFLISLNIQFLAMSALIVAMGSSMTLVSITEDMKCNLKVLDKSARKKESPLKIIQQFNDFVGIHANAKQLSVNTTFCWWSLFHVFVSRLAAAFSEKMEFIFIILFSWSIVSICCNMLLFQFEMVKYQCIQSKLLLARLK